MPLAITSGEGVRYHLLVRGEWVLCHLRVGMGLEPLDSGDRFDVNCQRRGGTEPIASW